MLVDQLGEICCIYHIIRCDDNIWMMHFFDAFQVLIVSCDISVVDIVSLTCIGEKNLQLTTFGVDIIMTAGTDMCNQCTWFFLHIDLNTVNVTVA